jgi:hypothetical protein
MEKIVSILGKFIELKKISLLHVAGTIIFFTIIFIISPESLFGIGKASILGILFFLAIAFVIVCFIDYMKGKIAYTIKRKKEIEYIKKELENLDDHEKANLREFFRVRGKRTIKMPIDDSTVSGLLKRKILYLTSNNGEYVLNVGRMFNCSVNPEFEKYIDDKILSTPMEEHELLNSRPKWAYKFDEMLGRKPGLFE